jgi:hypothetical protein
MKTMQVFLSHTSDMALFPEGRSFVQAAMDAVGRARMVPVDMRYFAARDSMPVNYCREQVRACDIYIAIIGFRYGSVAAGEGVSYTESEFLAACSADLPRLVFLLAESAFSAGLADEDVGPVTGFRKRLSVAGLLVREFTTGDSLELEVFHALSDLESRLPHSFPDKLKRPASIAIPRSGDQEPASDGRRATASPPNGRPIAPGLDPVVGAARGGSGSDIVSVPPSVSPPRDEGAEQDYGSARHPTLPGRRRHWQRTGPRLARVLTGSPGFAGWAVRLRRLQLSFPPDMPGDEPVGEITAEGNRPVAAGGPHGGVRNWDTTVMQLATSPVLAEAADNLAREVRWTLEQEQKRRKIYAPDPLPARWRAAADHLTDPRVMIGVSCEGDGVADICRKVPWRRLVILGPAGSGKTVLAQQLALDYLNVREPSGAVPVVFSIGSWDPSTATLEQWMPGRLLRDHPFLDKATAVGLIADHRILPVLDGFDELAGNLRVMALEELNSAADRPLVLTSRLPEYENATMNDSVLYSAAVIELTGPSLEEVVAYLSAGGNEPAWTDVHDRLRSASGDQVCALLTEVLRNPLMAALARTIYKRRDPAKLLEKEFRTRGDVEEHLLSGFLRETYKNRPGERSRWGADRAQAALGYLADHLKQVGGSDLAWWEIGTTVPLLQRMLAVGTLCGLVFWLVLGAATLPVLPSYTVAYLPGPVYVSVQATGIGLAFGLAYGLAARFRGPPKPSRIQVRVRAGTRRQVRPALAKFRDGFIIGALCSGIAVSLIWAILAPTSVWKKALADLHIGADALPYLLSISLGTGLTLGLGLGLLNWLEVPVEAETVNGPLVLLRRNRATVRAQFLVVGLTSGLPLGIIYGFLVGPLPGCVDWILCAILIGTGWILSLTAWGQWVIFARVWLPLTGRLPWAAAAFLDDAHQRGVLRQSGAVYQFRHARLQDHLAVAQARRTRQNTQETSQNARLNGQGGWPVRLRQPHSPPPSRDHPRPHRLQLGRPPWAAQS